MSIKQILKYLKPYILQILVLTVFVVIQVQTDLALPRYLSDIINEGIILQDNDAILSIGLEMLGVTLIGVVASVIVGYFAARVSTGVSKDVREEIYGKVLGFSAKEMNKFSTASLLTRSTNDVQQIQMVIYLFLRMVISAPIMGVSAVINAFRLAPDLSWLIATAVGAVFAIIITVMVFAVPKFEILQKYIDKLNRVSRENLTGLRVIRAFNTQKYELEKFDNVNKELVRINLFINRLMVFLQPILFLIFNFLSIGVIWFGAKLIDERMLEMGDMFAFVQYASQVIMSFLMLTMIIVFLSRSMVSIQRIVEVLNTKNSIKEPKKPKKFSKKAKGKVEYKNVSFAYPDSEEPVIKNISFTASPGETTAFVGSTGSGKSTVINLLPRFYDVTDGEILIDGINIKDVSLKDLRDRIGYVPQKGYLFSGTIKSNLSFGKEDASEEELREASEIAQAYDFISEYKKRFNNPITQGGTNVSGGQKQRLSIARALVKNPSIYIFDDTFSALDTKTEKSLREALSKKTKDSTVLIVTQKIGTIMNADKIVVLDDGEIVGIGRHEELLKKCKVYREIALSQLSKEELKI
jgi:ATP-binding cassette subfamily B protein